MQTNFPDVFATMVTIQNMVSKIVIASNNADIFLAKSQPHIIQPVN